MTPQHSPADHVTPYDRFAWSDTDIERMLVTGEHDRDLAAYFGESEYRALVELARRAAAAPLDESARVLVVPGIMGSQLGFKRAPPLPNDIVWLDPIDIQVGRLSSLHLGANAPVVPLGVVLYSYLRLKLNLRASGFAPVLYDYDWRLDVEDLGHALAERIRSDSADRILIVAHSMGGLVSRAALTQPGTDKVHRLVLLGTPNFGAFAPLQALRGTYAVVRKIASLALKDSAESLAGQIFNTFPSLYQMLPDPDRNECLDLFALSEWPRSGPRPRANLLRSARALQRKLAPPDGRISTVVGVGEETVTGVVKRRDDFVYTFTRRGDGTVPAVSAALPGARNYYALAAHSDLTRDPKVAAAVTDLLRTGITDRLPSRWKFKSLARAHLSDRQLRRMHTAKVDWAGLEPEERLLFMENLNEPPKLRLRVPARAAARSAVAAAPELASRSARGPTSRAAPRRTGGR